MQAAVVWLPMLQGGGRVVAGRIFISYSRKEPQPARGVAEFLKWAGYSVWCDTNLIPGELFRKVIDRELNAADAVIVIWTNDSVVSDWVLAEAEYGRRNENLIPLRTRDLTAPIPLPYDTIHTGLIDDRPAILAAVARIAGEPRRETAGAASAIRGPTPTRLPSTKHAPGSAAALVAAALLTFLAVAVLNDNVFGVSTAIRCRLGLVDPRACGHRHDGDLDARSSGETTAAPKPAGPDASTSAAAKGAGGPAVRGPDIAIRPSGQTAKTPSPSVPAQRLRYGYADAAAGAVVEVVVGPADEDVFNGILSALGAHVLREGDGPPTMRLTISHVAVEVTSSGASADCLNFQTVELAYSLRPLADGRQPGSDTHVGRGRNCLDRQPDGFAAKQTAIRQAVADLRSHLAAGP